MSSQDSFPNNVANPHFKKRNKKKGFSFTKYVSKKTNQVTGFVKGFDLYGQPITLNY